MISRVMGSTRGIGGGLDGHERLQDHVVGVVDARADARRHQGRGVALVDDRRAREGHARGEAAARVAGRVGEAESRGNGRAGVPAGRGADRRRRRRPSGVARRGRRPMAVTRTLTSSIGCAGQIVRVEPAMLGVERGQQLLEPRGGEAARRPPGTSARSSDARSEGRRRARSASDRAGPVRPSSHAWACACRSSHMASSAATSWPPGRARRAAGPTVRTNVARMSVSSSPQVESTPGYGGITTRGMSSSSARRQAWSGPAPPKATSANRRGSWPRPTDTVRMPRAIELSMISTMPAAASSTPRPRGRATRASMAARAAPTSSGSSPPRSAGGMRPSTRWASVTVGSVPPRP